MSERPLIEFKHASLGYGRRSVLTGVTLAVPRGAFLGILGPNGAGKTTFLKTLLGLIPPHKGQMDVGGLHEEGLRYGYVPQKEKLDPIYPLSAFEIADMGTSRRFEPFRGLFSGGRADFVRRCLKTCGALELADRLYSDLSGGQRQRVLIARALAAHPEVLVLDEPLAGLDVATQKSLLKLFGELKHEGGLTVLMVSHRLQTERKLFSHVAWVDEGKVEFGPAASMLAHRAVAEFFGHEP